MNKPFKLSSSKGRIWFTSDLHLNHTPDWEGTPPLWQSRGFGSIIEHDEWVKERWYAMIKPEDTVYNLGDPTFSDPKGERFTHLTQYPGRQYLINGNHWSGQKQVYRFFGADENEEGFSYPRRANNLTFVGDTLLAYIDGVSVYMQHYPCFVWPELSKGGIHLHGHCHRRLAESNPERTDTGKVLDVGVDNAIAYNGTPFFSWDDVKSIMATKPVVKRDHH